jgi:hypothetical protein
MRDLPFLNLCIVEKQFPIYKSVSLSHYIVYDCLCGIVVRVVGYRFRGPGSIPGATRFSEK